jgi:TolB protein
MKTTIFYFRLVLLYGLASLLGACTTIPSNGNPTLQPLESIEPSPQVETSDAQRSISSEKFLVSMSFPGSWERVGDYEERYQGSDGFVSLGAKATETFATIQSVCEDEMNHVLQPFGADPGVQYMLIDGQEACVIFPSDDQNPTMENVAEIVVRYPFTLTINGSSFSFAFLQVFVTRDYASEIIPTIQFIR